MGHPHLAAAIAEELELCESRVRALLDKSIALSEGEVLAAAENLTELNRDAKAHVAALDGLRAQFQDDGRGTNLSAALEKQRRTVRAHAKALDEGLADQHDGATRAIGCTNQITTLAREIATIASSLSVLTLNARIESARAGHAANAFATIAASMRALSHQVHEANGRVADLASSLKDIIPSIEKRSRELRAENRELGDGVNAQLEELGAAYSAAREAAAQVVSGGSEHGRRVVSRTHQVLSHLQYQDRMAQTLREIESVLARARQVSVEVVGRVPGEHDAADVARELAESRQRAPSATRRFSGESDRQRGGALRGIGKWCEKA